MNTLASKISFLAILVGILMLIAPTVLFAESYESREEYEKEMERRRMEQEKMQMVETDDRIKDVVNSTIENIKPELKSEDGNAMESDRMEKKESLRVRLDTAIKENNERREDLRKNFEERKERLEKNKEERKNNLDEKRVERILNYAERMLERLHAAYNRLDRIIVRIESRIEKLKEVNKNIQTDDAEILLAEAKALIESGRLSLAEAQTAVDDVLESEDPKEAFSKVKEVVREAILSYKEAHKKMVEAVRSIKAVGGEEEEEDDDNATTTNS